MHITRSPTDPRSFFNLNRLLALPASAVPTQDDDDSSAHLFPPTGSKALHGRESHGDEGHPAGRPAHSGGVRSSPGCPPALGTPCLTWPRRETLLAEPPAAV